MPLLKNQAEKAIDRMQKAIDRFREYLRGVRCPHCNKLGDWKVTFYECDDKSGRLHARIVCCGCRSECDMTERGFALAFPDGQQK